MLPAPPPDILRLRGVQRVYVRYLRSPTSNRTPAGFLFTLLRPAGVPPAASLLARCLTLLPTGPEGPVPTCASSRTKDSSGFRRRPGRPGPDSGRSMGFEGWGRLRRLTARPLVQPPSQTVYEGEGATGAVWGRGPDKNACRSLFLPRPERPGCPSRGPERPLGLGPQTDALDAPPVWRDLG